MVGDIIAYLVVLDLDYFVKRFIRDLGIINNLHVSVIIERNIKLHGKHGLNIHGFFFIEFGKRKRLAVHRSIDGKILPCVQLFDKTVLLRHELRSIFAEPVVHVIGNGSHGIVYLESVPFLAEHRHINARIMPVNAFGVAADNKCF